MPTYDYQCDECGHKFEEFQSISAEPLSECPFCHGKVKRLIGGGNGFLFKGSGFYITDYRNEKYKNDKSKESDSGNKKETAKKVEKKKTPDKTTTNVA